MTDAQAIELTRAIREHSGLELSSIREAGTYGADAGWSGFTYTTDGAEFFAANRDLIWSMLSEDADAFGLDNPAALVATFTRADMTETPEGFDCLCAWYALEECGRFWNDRSER